jgi:hypothetical protein
LPPDFPEEFEIWYNRWRPHMTLDGIRPDDVYYSNKPDKPERDAKTVPCNIEQHYPPTVSVVMVGAHGMCPFLAIPGLTRHPEVAQAARLWDGVRPFVIPAHAETIDSAPTGRKILAGRRKPPEPDPTQPQSPERATEFLFAFFSPFTLFHGR